MCFLSILFQVQPSVIPPYWIWAYWINLFAWVFRGLAVNEYQSGKYDQESQVRRRMIRRK
jgi:hypothetical protein